MKDFVSKEAALDAVRDLHIGLDLDLEAAMHIKRLLARSCLLYTSPSPRDLSTSRMPSSA